MDTLKKDGYTACACHNAHTTFTFQRCGFLAITASSLILAGLFLPYTIAVCEYSMPVFLPFISDSGGFPPTTGPFAMALTFMVFPVIVLFLLLHQSIVHRNVSRLRKIRIANSFGVALMLFSTLGVLIVVTNPVRFIQAPSKFDWLLTVFFIHVAGANMAIMGIVCLQFAYTWIGFLLPDITTISKYTRLVIFVLQILQALTFIKPGFDVLWTVIGPEPFNIQLLKNTTIPLEIEMTTSYAISAFCEWGLVFLGAIYIFTYYNECQRISFHVIMRPKFCFRDLAGPTHSISLKPLP